MDELALDPRIKSVARLAEAFHCDPIQLLNCDLDEWLIRMAAAKALSADHERREKERKGSHGGY